MNPEEKLVTWALAPERTLEERYLVELLVEYGVRMWRARRKDYSAEPWEVTSERNRQRKLNPAYQPQYSETDLRHAAEVLVTEKEWSPLLIGERPIRDLSALRFMPNLEKLRLPSVETQDLTPLAELPRLRELTFNSSTCDDFTALSQCKTLDSLSLGFGHFWPKVAGLESLQQLESLSLSGNLLAFAPGISWTRVRRATLHCRPLPAENFSRLPALPVCEFLNLRGAWHLDGIENSPRLRNLTMSGPFADFGPLVALKELTWLTVETNSMEELHTQALDVRPLAKIPKLHYFKIGAQFLLNPPRDYSPLAEAPLLHELVVENCPPVAVEVATISACLPPWDDLFLSHEPPRPKPPLHIVVSPPGRRQRRPMPHLVPGESDLIDVGIRGCEGSWVERYVTNLISEAIGHPDWGTVSANGDSHTFFVTIESIDVIPQFLLILDTMREAMARLRYEYEAGLMISLRSPQPEPTDEEKEIMERAQIEEDEAEYQQWVKERAEYLERKHRYELLKQDGLPIQPEEFAAPAPEPPKSMQETANREDEFDEDADTIDEEDEGDFLDDDEHPLAENYRLLADVTMHTIWFLPHHRTLAVQLMGREPDEEYPDEPQP